MIDIPSPSYTNSCIYYVIGMYQRIEMLDFPEIIIVSKLIENPGWFNDGFWQGQERR